MNSNLEFRRQFILSKLPITTLENWICTKVEKYYLYTHPDLPVCQQTANQTSIVLIGSIFDSEAHSYGNDAIIRHVLENTLNFKEVILQLKRYAGRYAVIYTSDSEAYILNDALALREIYFCTVDNSVICGSQPNILVKFSNPEILRSSNDKELLEFYTEYLRDSKWIGEETCYEGIKHLLPNHVLDLNNRKVSRYWPNEPIKKITLDEAVNKICSFLQGIMSAMASRHSLMMAVTAGTDSRALLAASRNIKDKIYYFINDEGLGCSHPDISVPTKICKGLDIPFHIHDVQKNVDGNFKRIFLNNTFFATERILPTIYNVYYKAHSNKVNILGIGEIGRTRYGKVPGNLNSYRIAYKLGYPEGCRYVIKKCQQMLKEMMPVANTYGINLLTLIYWEQMLGNWGVVGNSESDIAIEELNPFDSHLLYEIFLRVDDKYTNYSHPIIFTEIIRRMWPELLQWPINPPYKMRDKIIWNFKKFGIYNVFKEFKYQANYMTYLLKERFFNK